MVLSYLLTAFFKLDIEFVFEYFVQLQDCFFCMPLLQGHIQCTFS